MKLIAFLLVAVATVAGVVAFTAAASGHADDEPAPLFGIKIPPGYRDWKLISVAHEEGNLNDLAPFWATMLRLRLIAKGSFRFLTAQSLPGWLGVTSHRKKTTKSLAVPNLSLPGPPRTFSLWSRTQKIRRNGRLGVRSI